MKVTGMLVVSLRGVNFGLLVSLRVFRKKMPKTPIFLAIMVSFRVTQKYTNINSILSFLVSFRGQERLEPHPDWSLLGVLFKISDEHPRPFHTGVPPRVSFNVLAACRGL